MGPDVKPSSGRELVTVGYGFEPADLPEIDLERPGSGIVDPRAWFDAPEHRFEIEIGSGKGTFLVQQGALRPEVNYLGIEWARAYYRYAADRACSTPTRRSSSATAARTRSPT